MRIVIETTEKKIVCPKTFWEEVQKKNDILKSVGQEPVSHKNEVRKYFEEAMENELARPADLKKK